MENMYLKLDGIDGDSTSKQGDKQIEVLSFSHGVTMPVTAGAPSGVSVKHGRCDHQDLTITKYTDSTSPTLNLYCSAGNNIKTAQLTVWQADKADGDPVQFYCYELEDVLITSMSTSGSSGLPVETLTLHYNKIKWTYTVQNKDAPAGSKGKKSTGWDLEKNTKV